MKKRVLALCPASFFSVNAFALVPRERCHHQARSLLSDQCPPSTAALLPPPPAVGSIAFLNDQAMYEQGRLLRNTERGKLAAEDANLSAGGVANAFSSAFGSPITEKDAPQLHKLLTNMIEDAGDRRPAARKIHAHSPVCVLWRLHLQHHRTGQAGEKRLLPVRAYFYRLGHRPVLAEINPQRQNEILKRGYELGESRVICGYHWQSDVDAARIVGSAVVATLHTNPAFQQQLQKAKDEFAKREK